MSINGDVISGGNNRFIASSKNINGRVFDNQEIYMVRLMPNIEKEYLAVSDYYEDDYVANNCNENINKSKYISCSFICNNYLSVNNSAVVSGGNVIIKNQSTNMNNSVLASIVGDIEIESNNISMDGIIYAPLGKVRIIGDNINLNGAVIAQEIIIEGSNNVNLNRKTDFLNSIIQESVSAVKYGAEDTDEIDIGEAYFKDISSEDDIIYAGEGLFCVKNQFLLSVKEDVAFEVINELVNQYDASIVGYIELTNDYQVELRHDVEITDVMEIINTLSGIDYILSADLNLISETEECFRSDDREWPDEWDEDIRDGNEIAAETIKLKSALIKAGVIENESSTDIDLSRLYDVKVGIIDWGFDEWNSEDGDLVFTKIWENYENQDELFKASDYHGTQCAGAMAAEFNNRTGISGIAVKNRLYAFGECDRGIIGKNYSSVYEDKYALALLIGNNVRVISRSLGLSKALQFSASTGNKNALNNFDVWSTQLSTYLRKFIEKGYDFIIVNSAGNTNNLLFYKDDNLEDTKYGYVYKDEYNAAEYPYAKTATTYGSKYSTADVVSPDGGRTFYNVDGKYGNYYAYITDPIVRKRIVIVGAMDIKGLNISGNYEGWMCDYSNRGKRVDICALGEGVWTCTAQGKGKGDKNNYDVGRGTSIATPQVAGALGLAYSVNPALTADELVSYLVNKYTDYTNDLIYEIEPLDDKFKIKYVNAEELVSGAIKSSKAYSSPHIMHNISDAIITGSVFDLNFNTMSDVEIAVQKMNENGETFDLDVITTKTDNEGFFTLSIPAGNYQIMFYKEGYHSTIVYSDVEAESASYLGQILLVKIDKNNKSEGIIKGHVVDATNGLAVDGAVVKFKRGWNNRYGSNIGFWSDTKAYTDNNGDYKITLPIGAYTAEIAKEGYYTAYTNIIVSAEDRDAFTALSPEVNENEYRVVLTWGDTPSDLDSHLTGYIDGNSLHVYYGNQNAYSNGELIASLDHDDTSSYGPETITFSIADDDDTVTYYVHDYSNGGNSNSYALSFSNATVTVYSGNNIFEPIVYHIPVGKAGTDWYVFEIKNGRIKKTDRIQ